jgi:acetoin utilization protein AcuB
MPDKPVIDLVMTRNPITISSSDSIRVAVDRMQEKKCRRLPVVDNGKLVGMVTDRDLRRATNSPLVLRERWYDDFMLDHIPVRACMTENPMTVTPQTPIVEVAKIIRDRKFGGLPVLDGDKLVGIVTETDLMNYLIWMLE